jgi:hypothetical protein
MIRHDDVSEVHMPQRLKSHELVTLAVYLTGGDTREVDTEDVAIKVNELAPGRFTWRKHADQINIEIIRASLSDAKKKKNGATLTGTGNAGWLLTEDGLKFSKENVSRVAVPAEAVERLSQDEKRRRRKEQARVAASAAFQKFSTGEKDKITKRDVDAVFRLNEYIVGSGRLSKIQRIVNSIGDDEEVGAAVRFFAKLALKETT